MDNFKDQKITLLQLIYESLLIYKNATGLITEGTNITITGTGTLLDPYIINSTGGGSSVTASNGLTKTGDDITLGGSLTGNTTVDALTNNFIFNVAGISAITLHNRRLLDNTGTASIYWNFRFLADSTDTTSLHWDERTLNGSTGNPTISWGNYLLKDSFSITTLNWNNKTLLDENENVTLDWSTNRTLNVGQWSYDADYSSGYTNRSLVDKEYVETEVAAVATTTISGTSVFDFGNEGDYSANVIANVLLTNTNFKSFSWIPQETTATSIDDFKLNAVLFVVESITDSTNFTIRGVSDNGATGNYTIKYIITY